MKKLLKSLLLSLCFVFAATPLMAAMPFTDVKTSDWFYDEVQFAYDNDLFQGTSATTFSPQTGMTRAMFVTVLGRMSNVDITQYTDVAFADVVPGSWYAPYVQWAYQEGITNGISKTEFGVNNPVTREQMAKFLCTYADYTSVKLNMVSQQYDFNDDMDISSWARSYIYQCQKYGLLNGREYNYFDPHKGCTRAEAATVIMRLNSVAKGNRLVVNYAYSSVVPTFDSVTLNFCHFAVYNYDCTSDYEGYGDNLDYYKSGYIPNADYFLYKYDAGHVSSYYDYLTAHDFILVDITTVKGETFWTFQKGNEYAILGIIHLDGTKYIVVDFEIDYGEGSPEWS